MNAPVLLIVGGRDDVVIDLNEKAFTKLRCKKELIVIPGATHLFDEPGTLETVAELAAGWFARHFKTDVAAATTQGGNNAYSKTTI